MPLCRFASLGLGCLMALLSACPALPADPAAEFPKARTAIAQKLRSRVTADRVAAINRLADYPTAESATLVVKMGCADRAAEVRDASYQVLRKLARQPEVAASLAKEFQRETHAGTRFRNW